MDADAACLEYSTAVAETKKDSVEVSGGASQIGAARIAYETSRDIAQIYTVSDTLQFGHAGLYRLCEARANGFINNEEWKALYQQTFESTRELLQLQVDVKGYDVMQKLVDANNSLVDAQEKHGALTAIRNEKLLAAREALDRILNGKPQEDQEFARYFFNSDLSVFSADQTGLFVSWPAGDTKKGKELYEQFKKTEEYKEMTESSRRLGLLNAEIDDLNSKVAVAIAALGMISTPTKEGGEKEKAAREAVDTTPSTGSRE